MIATMRRRPWPEGSFLGRLSRESREALLGIGVNRRFHTGQILLREGDETEHAILLRTGFVKVTATTEEGGSTLLALRSPGDLVGELAAVSGAPRSATVTAAVMVTGNEISRPELLAFLRRYPEAALALTVMEGDRLWMANRRRMDISGYGTRGRIARLLIELREAHGRHGARGCDIDVGLSHREVAELVGASEVSVQRALRTLRMAGLIEIAYRRITIVDADALIDVARHG